MSKLPEALNRGKIQAATDRSPQDELHVGLLFLSNFVHQVVNPMSGVIGTLSNITDDTYSDVVAKQKINACRAQLQQCVSLIRNLAFLSDYFSKSTDKVLRTPARETATSVLPQVIIEAIQFFQILGERKGIRLELVDSQSQYRVKVRPELLKQVFINLFDNWLKYGKADQVVKVTPAVNASGDLTIGIVGQSIGFRGSDAENIFKLGFRSDEAMQMVAQGSGIGLHICRQIMTNALDGTIRAEHNRKTGITTFRLTIPGAKWAL